MIIILIENRETLQDAEWSFFIIFVDAIALNRVERINISKQK